MVLNQLFNYKPSLELVNKIIQKISKIVTIDKDCEE